MVSTQTENTQAQRRRVRHVLVIEDNAGRRTISLEAATYSLGRDPSCAIVLHSNYVSRQHAILLRVPIPGTTNHLFRILDGNARGERSTNGLLVNGDREFNHDLNHGDTVAFSRDTTATYYMTANLSDQEFAQYAESAGYRSLKLEVEDASQTTLEGRKKL